MSEIQSLPQNITDEENIGTGKELIEKAYKDSELIGREYERIVKYVESILNE